MGARSIAYTKNQPELGRSPEHGFHCSGLVRYVLERAGLHIPDYIGMDNVRRPIERANEFWDHYGIAVHEDTYQSGDLILFSKNGIVPTHIGIVRDEESYVHAPGKENTWVTTASIARTAIEHAGNLRGMYSFNPIGFKAPVVPLEQPSSRYHQRVA